VNDLEGWLGYELTILFSLVAIFGFQFATYVKIRKIEGIFDDYKADKEAEDKEE